MSELATRRQWRAWQRRAATLRERGQALMCDMVEALGPEHEATDFADNIVDAAEAVLRCADRALSTPQATDSGVDLDPPMKRI